MRRVVMRTRVALGAMLVAGLLAATAPMLSGHGSGVGVGHFRAILQNVYFY